MYCFYLICVAILFEKKWEKTKRKKENVFFCLMNIFGHMTSVGQLDHLIKTVKINTSTI